MKDYSFIGTGIIYLEEVGGTAGLVDVGNCSALSIKPQEESKKLPNYRQPGGGTYNEVRRVGGMELSYTFHDFSPENFARALRSAVTAVTGGSVTGEVHKGHKGGFIAMAKLPASISSVSNTGGALSEGDDYVVVPGGVIIPEGASITNDEDLTFSYTAKAAKRIDALTVSAKQYRLVLIGQNEARGGKMHRVEVARLSHGLLNDFSVIGDDYGGGEVSGEILYDAAAAALGGSGYFNVVIED